MAHKKTTGGKIASKAGSLLGGKKTPAKVKSVAASALSQTKGKKH